VFDQRQPVVVVRDRRQGDADQTANDGDLAVSTQGDDGAQRRVRRERTAVVPHLIHVRHETRERSINPPSSSVRRDEFDRDGITSVPDRPAAIAGVLTADGGILPVVRNVTDRTSNPFGLRPPFDRSDPDDRTAVFGYGDANADFHVIGDYPGIHGGESTGVPFTETESGLAIQDVLRETGFASGPRDEPVLENCFLSYVPCAASRTGRHRLPRGTLTSSDSSTPNSVRSTPTSSCRSEPRRPTRVLREYTTQRRRFDLEMGALHAAEIRGRGFMVVPIEDPAEWGDGDFAAIVSRLEALLASDYRQTKGVATTVG